MMKSLLTFSVIVFLFVTGVSCSSNDDDFPPVSQPISSLAKTPDVNTSDATVTTVDATFKADLKPITGVTSTGSGSATLLLDKTTKVIEINIDFSGIDPFLASINRAGGKFLFNYTPYIDSFYNDEYVPFGSPVHFGRTLSDAEIAELMNNQYYLVLHTTANPNGEISGELKKQ